MTPDKLNKYRKGNFELKSKHIYAKKKLENIRDYILLSHNLVGGSIFVDATTKINEVIDQIDKVEVTTDVNFKDIKEIILNTMNSNKKNLLINNEDEAVFKELIEADENLTNTFNSYRNINDNNYDGIDDAGAIQNLLINIQKNLFKLQAKIIFSSLKKIKKANVTNLFELINKKIEAMNNYINKQEDIYNEPSKPNTKSEAKIDTKSNYIVESKSVADAESKADAKLDTEYNAIAESKANVVSESDAKKLFYIKNGKYEYEVIEQPIQNIDTYELNVNKSIDNIEGEFLNHYNLDKLIGSTKTLDDDRILDKKFINIFNNMGFNNKYLLSESDDTANVKVKDFYNILKVVRKNLINMKNNSE